MSYQQKEQPTCKYCSTEERKTPIKFKKNEMGKWLVFNMDGTEHSRQYCDSIKTGQVLGNALASNLNNKTHQQNNTGAIDPHLNSILIRVSDCQKAIMELKQLLFNLEKSAQTNATVIDGMAQKIELMLQKTGYPEPKPLDEEQADKLRKRQQIDQLKDKQIIESLKEVQNLTPLPPIGEEGMEAFEKTQEQIREELLDEREEEDTPEYINRQKEQRDREESTISNWQEISEAFACNNCNTKTHNGFMKWGTKFCPTCKDNIDR